MNSHMENLFPQQGWASTTVSRHPEPSPDEGAHQGRGTFPRWEKFFRFCKEKLFFPIIMYNIFGEKMRCFVCWLTSWPEFIVVVYSLRTHTLKLAQTHTILAPIEMLSFFTAIVPTRPIAINSDTKSCLFGVWRGATIQSLLVVPRCHASIWPCPHPSLPHPS